MGSYTPLEQPAVKQIVWYLTLQFSQLRENLQELNKLASLEATLV